MSQHLVKRHLQGLTGGTITLVNPDGSAITGYVSPNLQGLNYSHKAQVDRVPNQSGNTGSLIIRDDMLEITFDFFPQGTNAANAALSALVPAAGASAVIAGLPVIQLGGFADAFNSDAWIYEGDANGTGSATEKWTGQITLRRYKDITNPVAVAAA